MKIALQMYTLRDFCKTAPEIAKTLARVRQIGYTAVQVSGMGPIEATELAKILRGEGLTCCATHIPMERMETETQKVIDDHAILGCKYTAIGGFFQKEFIWQDWLNFFGRYNAIAAKFSASPVRIGYHNHSHEFMKVDGRLIMQSIIDNLSADVWMEIDTYWVQHGGADPIQWINKVKKRIPCVHLKDMSITFGRQQLMAEVGEGNLNWSGILSACKLAGVEWYIIEQDVCQRDPFESVEISLKNLLAMDH